MGNHEGHKSHGIWMMLCCLIPVMMVAMLYFMKLPGTGIKSVLSVMIILICPLGHLLMMMFMSKGKRDDKDSGTDQ